MLKTIGPLPEAWLPIAKAPLHMGSPAGEASGDEDEDDVAMTAAEQSADADIDAKAWRARLTPTMPSPGLEAPHICPRRISESDTICWADAEPFVYYTHARVDLTTLEVPDMLGDTWVHRATESKNVEVVEDLLDRVENRLVNCQNLRGATPLHCAAGRDAIDIAVLLLTRGADVTRRDQDGNTALAVACSKGASQGLVELLLGHPETDINTLNHAGDTPLMSVITQHHNHLIDSLIVAPYLDWQSRNAFGQQVTQVALGAHNIIALSLIASFLSAPQSSGCATPQLCCALDDTRCDRLD